MNIENIEKILNNPLLNKNEFARRMFPDRSGARQLLRNKLLKIRRNKITEKDSEVIKNIVIELVEELKEEIKEEIKEN